MEPSPYDGGAVFYVRDIQDLVAAVSDPDYQQNVLADEGKFIDLSGEEGRKRMLTVGWEEVYVLDGKVVDLKGDGKL